MSDPVQLSIVIPVCNEEFNLVPLHERLVAVLNGLHLRWEIWFVNDGSTDDSERVLREIAQREPQVRVLFFSRNFGHQPAISAGIDRARGEAVIVMDGDLQDPPEFIPTLLAKWKEGYGVVYAIRKHRKEPFHKRAAYTIFYRVMRRMANVEIPLDAGDFSLMDRKVIRQLAGMPERNKFIRGLRSWAGFRQIGIECERGARVAGEPQYTYGKLLRLAFDGFISFSYFPLRAALWTGLLTFFLCCLYVGYALYGKLILGHNPQGWTSLAIGVMMLGGMQLTFVGIVGEYIGRIYDEVKQRPYYVIAETINVN